MKFTRKKESTVYKPQEQGNKYQQPGAKPVTGDNWQFFIIHNIISALIFFWLSDITGVLENRSELLAELISFQFLSSIVIIFGIFVFSAFFGRLFGYYVLKIWYVYIPNRMEKKGTRVPQNKALKGFWQMLTGINSMGYTFFISTLLSSILFAIGALAIIQSKLFGQDTFVTLLLTYVLVKVVVYFISKYFVEKKL